MRHFFVFVERGKLDKNTQLTRNDMNSTTKPERKLYYVELRQGTAPNKTESFQSRSEQAAKRKACAIAREQGYMTYEVKNEAGRIIYYGYRG